jgi:hypothetical protein
VALAVPNDLEVDLLAGSARGNLVDELTGLLDGDSTDRDNDITRLDIALSTRAPSRDGSLNDSWTFWSTFVIVTPRKPRTTLPLSLSCGTTVLTVLTGTAKPRF